MGLAEQQLPLAPRCTGWCVGHDGGPAWQVHRAATTKTCRRVVTVSDGGDDSVEIHLKRFAAVEDGRLVVAEPVIEVNATDALSVELAGLLADTLVRVTELVHAPEVAA